MQAKVVAHSRRPADVSQGKTPDFGKRNWGSGLGCSVSCLTCAVPLSGRLRITRPGGGPPAQSQRDRAWVHSARTAGELNKGKDTTAR